MSALVIRAPIACADVPGLCERVRRRAAQSDADVIVCDVRGLARPNALTVHALARLQLTARRLGRRVRLLDPPPELRDLLRFVGLDEALPAARELRVEPVRQAEQGEEPRGVQERVEPGDPAARDLEDL
jgi:anti-anti-sigma regulatory factor